MHGNFRIHTSCLNLPTILNDLVCLVLEIKAGNMWDAFGDVMLKIRRHATPEEHPA